MAVFTKFNHALRNLRLMRLSNCRIWWAACAAGTARAGAIVFEMVLSSIGLVIVNHFVACLLFHISFDAEGAVSRAGEAAEARRGASPEDLLRLH